jgi:hypothetical protein
MRIAFVYGSFSLGQRPFDFDQLYTARRGLTGSELSWLEYALAMKDRGHDVLLVVGQPGLEREWRGIRVTSLTDPKIVADCDVVFVWNEPNLCREIPAGPLRVVNQQLNDFGYCRPGWEEWCDLVTSPSAHHLAFLKKQAPAVRAWAVLPNGCDPSQYRQGARVPGRVIWASSADRGLHRLLECWPAIKARVPHASLRAFYNYAPAHFDDYEAVGQNVHPDLLEIAQRKRYVEHAMSKLSDPRWDVEHVGSVGRKRMALEFEHAEVLGYFADTIRYTEGFSVTTMEACASGCLPVTTDVDSLGHIYGDAVPMVKGPFDARALGEFVDLVVRGLTDPSWRTRQVTNCLALAADHDWTVLAETLEGILEGALAHRSGKKPKKTTTTSTRVDAEGSAL